MASRTSRTIRQSIDIAVEPEQVFDAFVNPDVLKKWFVKDAQTDPKPGGVWWFDFGPKGGGIIGGQYALVEPPSRLIWTWNEWTIKPDFTPIPFDPARDPPWVVSVCDVTITRTKHGANVQLDHYGYPDMPDWDDLFEGVNSGWEIELKRLRAALEDGDDVR